MARYELTDFEWKAIEPHLPNKPRGVPRVDDRRVCNDPSDSAQVMLLIRKHGLA